MKKRFPVDVWSIKTYGIERWHRECSNWPLSDSEFGALDAEIEALYAQTIIGATPEVGDALMVLYKLTIEYASLLHAVIVVERLHQAGLSLSYNSSSLYYEALTNKTDDIQGLFHDQSKLWPQTPSFKQRIDGFWRSLKTNIKSNAKGWNQYLGLSGKGHYLAVKEPTEVLKGYATSHNKPIRFIYPFPLIPKRASKSVLSDIAQAVVPLMNGLQEIAISYDVRLHSAHLNYLETVTKASLLGACNNLFEIRQALRKGERSTILVKGMGSTLVRTVCVAGKREGHQIVGATHGNSVGIFKSSAFANIDLSMVTTYLVPTKGAVKLFKKTSAHYPLSSRQNAEMVSYGNQSYQTLWQENNRRALPSAIKKVMFLEYPLAPFRHKNVLGFWPYQLDLTLRVAQVVRQQGVKTILKRHPDRLRESAGLYEPYFDKLMTERFESVYDATDAYLFTNIATTTFGFALLTNKPVIFFEVSLADLWEEVHEPLRKRCRVIPSWFDKNGRLMFNEEALVEALRKKPDAPDREFIERYMFPEGEE